MPPVTLQLTGVGVQDSYLTVNPEINVFKYRYYRYVNFATEVYEIPLSDISDFGKKFFAIVPSRGHFLSKLFLKVRLPPLIKKNGTFASWTNGIGYALIDWIEFEINGIVIEKLYGYFLDMYDEFTVSDSDYGKRSMILKSDSYFASRFNATKEAEMMIPLKFWFSKQPNMALPIHLFSPTTRMKINVKFRNFDELIHYDGTEAPDRVYISDIELFGEYIYLDEEVLKTFETDTSTKYIINQLQTNDREVLPTGFSVHMSELKFNHPVSELVFAFVQKESAENNDLFNYSDRITGGPLVDTIGLILDGQERFSMFPESYYRVAFPSTIHSFVPSKYVYCIPFSNRPELNQPTGSLNFSRFDSVSLKFSRKTPNSDNIYLYIFGINYNILNLENGVVRLEFSS